MRVVTASMGERSTVRDANTPPRTESTARVPKPIKHGTVRPKPGAYVSTPSQNADARAPQPTRRCSIARRGVSLSLSLSALHSLQLVERVVERNLGCTQTLAYSRGISSGNGRSEPTVEVMSVPDPSRRVDTAAETMAPGAPAESGEGLCHLGEALKARTEDVVAGMVLRTQQSGHVLDALVEERFARVGTVSTLAVARWMAGEGPEVAREVGREAWHIFGQLAAQRAAPLNEVTKRCLRWCDAVNDVVRELVSDVRDALVHSGLQPSALTLELTETSLMRNADETARRLIAIKQLGVRIAIDDFGTGYSSLAHLQRFPVDALKIDRSFISGLTDNQEGETLLRTLVQLGKSLSIETLAEGIEHPRELSLLQAEQCDSGQGFLFARPLDTDAAEALLRDSASNTTPAPAQTSQRA